LVINLKTVTALGIAAPPGRADLLFYALLLRSCAEVFLHFGQSEALRTSR
jgi:hypothetical protein